MPTADSRGQAWEGPAVPEGGPAASLEKKEGFTSQARSDSRREAAPRPGGTARIRHRHRSGDRAGSQRHQNTTELRCPAKQKGLGLPVKPFANCATDNSLYLFFFSSPILPTQ